MFDGTTIAHLPEAEEKADADFHAIYLRNIRRVYRLCYLRLGHKEDAEDAAQNVFARWLRAGTVFESEEHEKAYFLRAACNESNNVRKSFWRLHRVDYEDIPEQETAVWDDIPEENDLLKALPPRYREVLYLYYYEELTTAEIAKLLSRNESTVRTQLQTGRDRLREYFTAPQEPAEKRR